MVRFARFSHDEEFPLEPEPRNEYEGLDELAPDDPPDTQDAAPPQRRKRAPARNDPRGRDNRRSLAGADWLSDSSAPPREGRNRRTAAGKTAQSDRVEMQKQISVFIRLSDWKLIRLEAARLKIPMTELCRRWMRRHLDALRDRREESA